MRKIFVFLFLLLSMVFVFAEENLGLVQLGTAVRDITAYKRRMGGELPEKEIHFRLLDSNSEEFGEGYDLSLPLFARQNSFSAFAWVLSGNVFNAVTLKFTFSPMYNEGDTGTTWIIPYDVQLNHSRTSMGNTPIPINRESTTVSFIENNFTPYKYKYADSVTGTDSSISVTNNASGVDKALVYNMQTYTKVYNQNEEEETYPYEVCDFWNRYGEAVVYMNITEEGYMAGTTSPFANGVYYAVVRAEVTIN